LAGGRRHDAYDDESVRVSRQEGEWELTVGIEDTIEVADDGIDLVHEPTREERKNETFRVSSLVLLIFAFPPSSPSSQKMYSQIEQPSRILLRQISQPNRIALGIHVSV